MMNFCFSGSTVTDFAPQLQGLNRSKYTIVGWDPRGHGQSRPPDRDYPLDFYYRDAADAASLMEVTLYYYTVFTLCCCMFRNIPLYNLCSISKSRWL